MGSERRRRSTDRRLCALAALALTALAACGDRTASVGATASGSAASQTTPVPTGSTPGTPSGSIASPTASTGAPEPAGRAPVATSVVPTMAATTAVGTPPQRYVAPSPDDVPWILPTWLPDGVTLWRVAATYPVADRAFLGAGGPRWIRRAADGRTVDAVVDTATQHGEPSDDDRAGATVVPLRGGEALVRTDAGGASVLWGEQGVRSVLFSRHLDADALLALAASAVLDPLAHTVTPAAASGFVAVAPSEDHPPWSPREREAVTAAGRWVDGGLAQTITIRVRTARRGETLDNTVLDEVRRVVIDGIERSVSATATAPPEAAQTVRWYDAGRRVEVALMSPLDDASLDRLVAGLRRVGAAEAHRAQDAITAAGLAAPALASARTDDGVELSARGGEGDTRWLCAAHATGSRCVVVSPVVFDLAGGIPRGLGLVALRAGDRRLVVGWTQGVAAPEASAGVTAVRAPVGWFAYLPVDADPPYRDVGVTGLRPVEDWDLFW